MQWIMPIGRSGRGNDGVTVVFANGKLAILLLSALVVAYGLVGGSMDRVAARDASTRNSPSSWRSSAGSRRTMSKSR